MALPDRGYNDTENQHDGAFIEEAYPNIIAALYFTLLFGGVLLLAMVL